MIKSKFGTIAVALAFLALMQLPAGAQQERMRRNPNAGFLGVKLGPVSDEVQEKLKLDSQDGIVIMELVPGSPAEKSGVKADDVVRKVDDKDIADVQGFVMIMSQTKPGQTVKFSIIREGKAEDLNVTLGTLPQEILDEIKENEQHDHDHDADKGADKGADKKGPATRPG